LTTGPGPVQIGLRMDAQLLAEALARALDEPEITAAIATLSGDGDPQPIRERLTAAVTEEAQRTDANSRAELERLQAAERDLGELLVTVVTELAAADPRRARLLPRGRGSEHRAAGAPSSAESFLPVSATVGLSTYVYERVEKRPGGERLLAPTITERRATVCFHDTPEGPRCSVRRWP
jgi:hypothetical protein